MSSTVKLRARRLLLLLAAAASLSATYPLLAGCASAPPTVPIAPIPPRSDDSDGPPAPRRKAAPSACSKDSDCAGTKICESQRCVEPAR